MEKSDEECIVVDSNSDSDSDVIFLEETKKRKLDLSPDGSEIVSDYVIKRRDTRENPLDSSLHDSTCNRDAVDDTDQSNTDQPDCGASGVSVTSNQTTFEFDMDNGQAGETQDTPITSLSGSTDDDSFIYDFGLSDNNSVLDILNSGLPRLYKSKSTSEGLAHNDKGICLNVPAPGPTHKESQIVSKGVHKAPSLKVIRCLSCPDLSTADNTIQCVRGHSICKECIEKQTKSLLQRSGKGGLTCCVRKCDEQFSSIDLEDMLPSMVIDILVARTQAPADPALLKQMYADDDGTLGGAPAKTTKTGVVGTKDIKEDHFPSTWASMDTSVSGYEMFDVPTDSVEYSLALCKFYDSMTFPKSEILSIKRVQNPILWKFFSMKKAHMKLENSNVDVTEELLFHGTSRKVMNAICKDNFDWRVSGTHGTVHGVGSYFARNAGYSDRFTDQTAGEKHERDVQACSACRSIWRRHTVTSRFKTKTTLERILHQLKLGVVPSTPTQSLLVPQPSTSTYQAPTPTNFVTQGPSRAECPNCGRPTTTVTLKENFGINVRSNANVMFLARVLVGNYAQGSPKYRKPPPINPANPLGRLYDSCVDNYASPGIYVIFDTAQCYPEYIIEYKHN